MQRPEARLGQPIATLGAKRFHRLVARAGVPRIRFHDLRHVSATLDLAAGTPITDVSKRLGHATVSMTLNVYGYSMPDQQKASAARRGEALSGK
jgi:integrase